MPQKVEDNYFMKSYESTKLMNSSYNADFKHKKA